MLTKTREYIAFWIEKSVHAAEQYGAPGASQGVDVLIDGLVKAPRSKTPRERSLKKRSVI